MATRVYSNYRTVGAAVSDTLPVTPSSWSTGWNKTTGAYDHLLLPSKLLLNPSPHSTIPALSGTSGHFTALDRFVSPPLLSAVTISGTVKGQMRWFETTATDNLTCAIAIKVLQPDGTDRGILLAVSASDDTSATPPEIATTTTNRSFLDSAESASLTLSDVSASAGDYIVIEVGVRQASTSTATNWNNQIASTSNTDLPEDNTTVADNSPWMEFSSNLTFAPYYFNSASTPTDGAAATGTADPTAVTPPSGMLAGDLVCMIGQQRATGATLAVSEAGGQTWTSETAIGITNQTERLFWCVFNGTWGANPSVDFSAAVCNSVHMHVFRPPATDYTWSVNVALAETEDATSPFANPGQTTTGSNPTVTLVGWFSADDNTWSAASGTGYEQTGSAQYRNTSGSDQSATYAHKIQTSAGATGSVSRTQLTLGADASTTFAITFAAVAPAGFTPELPYIVKQAVNRAARF